MYQEYKEKAEFFFVYIREAHPKDGWAMQENEHEGISLTDPTSHDERSDVAGRACSTLKLSMPCLVDDMSDTVNKAYGAWPDRICVVDRDGKIAVMGGQGPWGFAPSVQAAAQWLANTN